MNAELLAGMIEYQPGAVVSRTLIKKTAGTLTLFAFDKGEGLSEHAAPFDAFVYIVDGTSEIVLAGKPQTVSAGQMLIMPANVTHSLKAVERFKMLLVMIKSAEAGEEGSHE